MRIILFIPSASVEGNQPSEWFKQRLDTAIKYYINHPKDLCSFVISGRWNNAVETYKLTEAEVAKRYILAKLTKPEVILEKFAVETAGNFAFAKPLITALGPSRIVVFNSKVNAKRIEYLARKIFDPNWKLKFIYINDALSQNKRAWEKEPKALAMFKKLLGHLENGDDKSAREILLYKTPFYNRSILDEKKFFNEYWPGGYEDFLDKRLSVANK